MDSAPTPERTNCINGVIYVRVGDGQLMQTLYSFLTRNLLHRLLTFVRLMWYHDQKRYRSNRHAKDKNPQLFCKTLNISIIGTGFPRITIATIQTTYQIVTLLSIDYRMV